MRCRRKSWSWRRPSTASRSSPTPQVHPRGRRSSWKRCSSRSSSCRANCLNVRSNTRRSYRFIECIFCMPFRAKWMKMSRESWSKYLPCVKTSPRRSKTDSLAGHCPFVAYFCVRSGVVTNHCHCSYPWCALWPSIASFPEFSGDESQEKMPSSELHRYFRPAEGKVAVISSESTAVIIYAPKPGLPSLVPDHLSGFPEWSAELAMWWIAPDLCLWAVPFSTGEHFVPSIPPF